MNCQTFWINSNGGTFIDSGDIHTAGYLLWVGDTTLSSATELAGRHHRQRHPQQDRRRHPDPQRPNLQYLHRPDQRRQRQLEPGQGQPGHRDSGHAHYRRLPHSAAVDILYNDEIADSSSVTINPLGPLNFGTSGDTIGNLILNSRAQIDVDPTLGQIGLTGNLTVNVDTVMGQKFNLGSTNHVITVGHGHTLTLAGQIFGSGGLTINGPGTTEMTGTVENYYTGTTTLNSGTLILDKANVGTDLNNAGVYTTGPS